MKKWPYIVTGLVVIFLLLGYWTLGARADTSQKWIHPNVSKNFNSMMGNWTTSGKDNSNAETNFSAMMSSGMGSMMGWSKQSGQMTKTDAQKEINSSLKHAVINKEKNSMTYSGDHVHIVLLGGPEEADGKFVIGTLVNPTIHVSKNAHVDLELINADEGMPHGIEITSVQPPYDQMSMMQGGILNGTFIHPIPAAQDDQYPVAQTSFQVNQKGEFYYICQYPGHAAKGMYGKIIFE